MVFNTDNVLLFREGKFGFDKEMNVVQIQFNNFIGVGKED